MTRVHEDELETAFTDEDLEDLCLGDVIRAGGSLPVAEVVPDFAEREYVGEGIERLVSKGYLRREGAMVTATDAGIEVGSRGRSFRVELPGDPPE
jgi:hypothetical protein